MSFQIQNILVNEAVEQTLLNQNNPNNLSYSPVWIYSENATSPGYFTIDNSGYKVVNEIDSNGVNIKYWINTLKLCIIGKSQLPGGLDIYIFGVGEDNAEKYFIQDLSNIIDNSDNTYTISGGDVYTLSGFTNDTKCYMSYITK
jgi:hypothetical protein